MINVPAGDLAAVIGLLIEKADKISEDMKHAESAEEFESLWRQQEMTKNSIEELKHELRRCEWH